VLDCEGSLAQKWNADRSPQRILAAQTGAHEGLVNDSQALLVVDFALREEAAFNKRDSQSSRVVRVDLVNHDPPRGLLSAACDFHRRCRIPPWTPARVQAD